jgi:hypothetical protein
MKTMEIGTAYKFTYRLNTVIVGKLMDMSDTYYIIENEDGDWVSWEKEVTQVEGLEGLVRNLNKIVSGRNHNYYVSVVKLWNGTYEIAVMEENRWNGKMEIDYQIFEDVMKADSLMEVYGIVEYLIKPAYL